MDDFSIKRIEPHFYYNALEYINALATVNNVPEINKVVLSLGEMMRYWTDNESEWVGIDNELDYIKQYLIITRLRYNYYFNFNIIKEDTANRICPVYVLEPILNDIILSVIGSDIYGIEIVISVKDIHFEILIKGTKLEELRCSDKITNNFIYGENRLKKLTDNDIDVKYEYDNTIVRYTV